jgi:aminobenzoyl-glutamate utilization protein B
VLEQLLAANGFRVTRPWAKLPTAFKAVAGSGKPVIAFLAEYDALPDCGPRPGQWGHGCGHNLLGVGSALAGIAAAKVLRQSGRPGKVVVFGTPAEESLGGKVYMAGHGGFGGLDIVLAWHPATETRADVAGGAAMDSLLFQFHGRTSHAAGAPHEGRSALDAALLTDVMINFLREHVPENTRMHCVITSGGKAPNVVPDFAEIWYYIRGKDRKQVDDLRRRVVLCVKAAALASQTKWRMIVQTCNTERIGIQVLGELLDAILRKLGPVAFSPAEVRGVSKIVPKKKYVSMIEPIQVIQTRGSSDEDNVSWFAPLGRLSVACVPKGTIGHNRQFAAASRTSGAYRGMRHAATAMAAAAVELAINPALLRKAQQEFRQKRKGRKYDLPLKPDQLPPTPAREGER